MEPQGVGFQPAKVQIKSKSGSQINVNIGKITGSCSVGNQNHITYIREQSEKPVKKTAHPAGFFDSSDSDSSDSSDDPEVDRWFKEMAGCEKPSRKKIEEAMKGFRLAKPKEPMNRTETQRVQTLIVKSGQPPVAYDGAFRQVQLKTQTQLRKESPNIANGIPTQASTSSGISADSNRKETKTFPGTDASARGKEYTKNKILSGITNPEQLVDRNLIVKISPHFGSNWRRVFRHLDVPDAAIDLQHLESGQVRDTVYQLLLQWTQSCERPTVGCLVEALLGAGHHNVIQVIMTKQ